MSLCSLSCEPNRKKKEIIFLAGVIDLDYQGQGGLLYTIRIRKTMSQMQEISLDAS